MPQVEISSVKLKYEITHECRKDGKLFILSVFGLNSLSNENNLVILLQNVERPKPHIEAQRVSINKFFVLY